MLIKWYFSLSWHTLLQKIPISFPYIFILYTFIPATYIYIDYYIFKHHRPPTPNRVESGPWANYFHRDTRGYKIDFLEEEEIPPRAQKSYPEDPAVTRCLNETIDKLERMGVCEQNPGNIPCYRENPRFCIESSGSDLRMIIDVSNLAPFIKGKRFKYEDLNAFLLQVQDDSWVVMAPRPY